MYIFQARRRAYARNLYARNLYARNLCTWVCVCVCVCVGGGGGVTQDLAYPSANVQLRPCLEIYSALRKYLHPFIFSRFVAALCKTALNYFFPTSIYRGGTILAKQKTGF